MVKVFRDGHDEGEPRKFLLAERVRRLIYLVQG
jgi:hypothetical protein